MPGVGILRGDDRNRSFDRTLAAFGGSVSLKTGICITAQLAFGSHSYREGERSECNNRFCRIDGENNTALRANTEGNVRVEDDVASFRSGQTNKAAGKVRSRFGASRLQDGLLSVHRADRRLLSTDVAAGKMEREGRNFFKHNFYKQPPRARNCLFL